jgi:hypothetical protein
MFCFLFPSFAQSFRMDSTEKEGISIMFTHLKGLLSNLVPHTNPCMWIRVATCQSILVQLHHALVLHYKALEGYIFVFENTSSHRKCSHVGPFRWSHANIPPFEKKSFCAFTLGKARSQRSPLILVPTPWGYNLKDSSFKLGEALGSKLSLIHNHCRPNFKVYVCSSTRKPWSTHVLTYTIIST